jgi:hypothetical protein
MSVFWSIHNRGCCALAVERNNMSICYRILFTQRTMTTQSSDQQFCGLRTPNLSPPSTLACATMNKLCYG